MRFTYSLRLDSKALKATELATLFSDLTTFFNHPYLDRETVDFMSINYRNLERPQGWHLYQQFGPQVGIGSAYSGYHPIVQSIITVTPNIDDSDNQDGTNSPVLQVTGMLWMCDTDDSNLIQRACIGYSEDNGSTWHPIVDLSRPTGPSCGDTQLVFVGEQYHYWTGIEGYYPFAQPTDPAMVLVASFGGDTSISTPTHITNLCIMTDDSDIGDSYLYGLIIVTMRDNTQ